MGRMPKFRFPSGQTWDYFKDVRSMLIKVHKNVIKTYENKIISIARMDGYKADDEMTKLTLILDTLREETFEFVFTAAAIEKTVSKFVDAVKNHTGTQFGRQFRAVLSIDPIGRDQKLMQIIQAANMENVSYIQSIPSNYHDKVETVILQGVRRGKSVGEISDELQNIYKVTRNRAKFIARDQAGSLVADMTKARHQAAGLEYFVWSTAGDSAVRSTHKAYDGIRFKWSEGAGGLLPGEDFGCRCTAEIDEEELLGL